MSTQSVSFIINAAAEEEMSKVHNKLSSKFAKKFAENTQEFSPVVTGFLQASAHYESKDDSNWDESESLAKSRADRPFAEPIEDLKDGEAVLHVSAAYALYQELEKGYQSRALELTVSEIQEIINDLNEGVPSE